MSIDRSRARVDPELFDLLDQLPMPELTAASLADWRTALRNYAVQADFNEAEAAVRMSVRAIPGPKGAPDVSVCVYQPASVSSPVGCIFHIHGGGYVGGAAIRGEPRHRALVAELGCVVVSVDYRLAPETCFPGNIEDCYAGLAWLFREASDLDVDVQRIGVMGESAGGGFAAALALLARDRGEFKLAFQHLIYPMLDDRTCITTDPHPSTGDFVWTAAHNYFGWSALLGSHPGGKDVSPYAAPARAPDLTRLPPTFISTATLDLFLEENIEYARRLMRAEVPVELHVYPRSFHGFDLHPTAKVARAAQCDSRAALVRFVDSKHAGQYSSKSTS